MATFKEKKQTTLNLNISLPQELVLKLLKEAEKEMIDLSLHIANKLDASLDELSDDLKLEENTLMAAMMRAGHLNEGDEFTLKDLFKGDKAEWEDVRSPRSFGRKFKKVMTKLNIAEVTGKQADNKLIYTRTDKEINMAAYFADGNDIYDDNWNG